ncbi:hypothetical protein CFC21_037089, partial [Triticum aestivum]
WGEERRGGGGGGAGGEARQGHAPDRLQLNTIHDAEDAENAKQQ